MNTNLYVIFLECMMDISIIIIDLTPGHYGLSRGQGHFNPLKMHYNHKKTHTGFGGKGEICFYLLDCDGAYLNHWWSVV